MRAPRLVPWCALVVLVLTAAVAVATSRQADWDKPLIFVLVAALALIADRYEVKMPDGSRGRGHAPGLRPRHGLPRSGADAAHGSSWSSSATERRTRARLVGNAAVYAVFLVAGSLLARPARDSYLGIATTSAWFSLVVVVLFVATWGLKLILHAVYVRVLAGVRIDRALAATWRPLVSAHIALACATAVLVYLVATVGSAVIALSGVILIAYSRLQRDLLQAERHAEAARQAATD